MFRVKSICEQKGISLKELSVLMDVPAESISRALSKKNGNPSLETLTKFAKALNEEVYDLFEKSSDEVLINGFVEINHEIYRINNFNDLQMVYNKLTIQK